MRRRGKVQEALISGKRCEDAKEMWSKEIPEHTEKKIWTVQYVASSMLDRKNEEARVCCSYTLTPATPFFCKVVPCDSTTATARSHLSKHRKSSRTVIVIAQVLEVLHSHQFCILLRGVGHSA